jgi:hypothetical protein
MARNLQLRQRQTSSSSAPKPLSPMRKFAVTDQGHMMPQSVVAFADALGTTASASSATRAATFLGRLQGATDSVSQRMNRIGSLYDIHVRWFSDSIAMSVSFDDRQHLTGLLENLAFVQAGYALNGIFLRGAVTTGPHHHSEYIDYGPALAEAVGLEHSRAGDTTRIVLSPSLEHDLQVFGTQRVPIAVDHGDHACFLDFLGALAPASRLALRSQIEAAYREAKGGRNAGVLQKIAWLASYYNWRTKPPKPLEYALDREFGELPSLRG